VEAAGGAPGHDAAAPDAAGGIADAAPDTGAICPTSITVTGQNETPGHGGQSLNDVLYTDSCPQGQVVVGYTGLVDSLAPASIGTVATVCGKLSINATGGCQITVTTGSSLPERGVYGDTEFRQLCPANQVVVGFQGRESAQLLNQVGFVCAPLVISRGAAGNTITLGPTTALTRAGGTAGTTYSESCPAGQIARGTNVTIAMGIVDAFGLICAPPVAR
jgi:hypothetical protein